MDQITFEQLPAAVAGLRDEVAIIKALLQSKEIAKPDTNRWFSLMELCDYLPGHPAKATVYSWTHKRKIPHKKFGKRLAFLKSEIDLWLNSQGRKTISEIEAEADLHLQNAQKKSRKVISCRL